MADTIAAFSVDEHIRWATARIDGRDIDRKSITFGEEVEPTQDGVIADQVSDFVAKISAKHPDIRQAQGIGVSVVGPVEVAKQQVQSVARKKWRARKPGSPVMELREIFSRRRHPLTYTGLAVQNDATCAAAAEWYFRDDPQPDDDLWVYITVNDGINCGAYNNIARPLFRYRHPEIGHAFPRMAPDDPFNPKRHSGCPAHHFCFEAIASGVSMQKRWGNNWDADVRAWKLEAFYVAQLCLTGGMLAFRADKVLLGGYVIRRNPDFLVMVRDEFEKLNAGYIKDEKMHDLETYISAGQFDDKVNVLGGLVLALETVVG